MSGLGNDNKQIPEDLIKEIALLQLSGKKTAEWLTLKQLIEEKAEKRGDAVFATLENRSFTYRQLDETANRVATALAGYGLSKGKTLVSFLYNCPEQLILFFATAKLGVIWAPLNAALVGHDLSYAINNTQAEVVIVGDDLWNSYAKIKEEVSKVKTEFVIGNVPPRTIPFQELLQGPPSPPAVTISPYDPATIVYTGGTTGLPKGVLLPNFAQLSAGYRYREMFSPTPNDKHLSVLQLFHTGGQQMGVVGPLISDIGTVILSRFSASQFWDQVRKYGGTIIDIFGAMLTMLMNQPERPDDAENPARISWGVTGQLSEEISRKFQERFGMTLLEVYALSENGGALLFHQTTDHRKPRSSGKSWGWADVIIVDDNDMPLPPGETGEILLRPLVPWSFMLEYFGDYERTVQVWRNLWLHTGDLGYLDEEGDLYFVGRQAHWLRRRGENISAHEVESMINCHTKILESLVVGVPSELGDEEVKAFIQLKPGETMQPEEIIQWCEDKIAPFKIPRFIEFVQEFPRSVTKQEIERFKLRAQGVGQAWDRSVSRHPSRHDLHRDSST